MNKQDHDELLNQGLTQQKLILLHRKVLPKKK